MSSGDLVHVEERCATGGAAYEASGNLRTVTTYDGTDEEKPAAIQYADGRVDQYVYGTSDAPGPMCDTVEVIHRISSGPVVGKTTSRKSYRTQDTGRLLWDETYAYISGGSGNSYQLIERIVRQYDARGRVTQTERLNGATTTTSYTSCCGNTTVIDESGIEIETTVDPILHRVASRTKLAENANLITSFDYDIDEELDFRVQEVATAAPQGSSESLLQVRYADLAGRSRLEVDDAGLQTLHVYDDSWTNGDGRKETLTRPGELDEITEFYRDSRIKSVTGDVVEQHYTYGVDANGHPWTKVATGSSISTRYVKTMYDALGRVIAEERPAFTPAGSNPLDPIVTTYEYYPPGGSTPAGAAGRVKSVTTDGLAPTLYVYDELGNVRYTGLDVANPGELDLDGADRVSETETLYQSCGSSICRETTTSVYTTNDEPDTVTTVQREFLTALPSGIVRWSEIEDAAENVTVSKTELDAENKTVTQKMQYPGQSSSFDVSVTINGLLQSATSRAGVETQYGYDALERRTDVTDGRENATTTVYDEDTTRVDFVANANGDVADYVYDEESGRLIAVGNLLDDDESYVWTRYAYDTSVPGHPLYRVWGDVPQPVQFDFNDLGERVGLHTYRFDPSSPDPGPDWTGTTWPSGAGDGDETGWTFDEATGLLTAKTYADETQTKYSYTPEGRLHTRTWARQVDSADLLTTYAYDEDTGELESIDYSDTTPEPDIEFTYTRTGLTDVVTDNRLEVTHDYDYDALLHLETETISELTSGVLYEKVITRGYSEIAPGRLESLQVGTTGDLDADYAAAYAYDGPTARMTRVTGPGLPSGSGSDFGAWYGYLTNSELVEKTEIKSAANAVLLRTTRGFEDHRDLLTSVENKWDPAGTPVVKSRYTYTNDRLARRTSVLNEGTAFSLPSPHTAAYNRYGYNDRNELTTAYRYLGDDLEDTDDPVPNEHFKYDYDPIGNRRGSWMGPEGEDPIIATDYGSPSGVANSLNQYDRVSSIGVDAPSVSNWIEHDEDGNLSLTHVGGDMNCDGQLNILDINIFTLAILDPGQYMEMYPECRIGNGDMNGDGEVDILDVNTFVYLAGANNKSTHTRYVWDAENRLIEVWPAADEANWPNGTLRSEYVYDYLGRRVIKRVYTWDSDEDE
ncbi:hypothetical protein RAS1_14800 [Phycisphaerae bacterium RAS1]|nr:hypothetical protein RAS1_14800 [Phycisphaerae bacterium RAS1]